MKSSVILPSGRQRGLVLFIALIALLIMSLAAVALIRSVDTNTVIAGNLALKQSALVSADRGGEAALTWIRTKFVANPTALDTNIAGEGYYATFDINGDGIINELEDGNAKVINLVNTNGRLETANDGQGNEVRYIVQRMCRVPETPTADICMLGSDVVEGESHGNPDDPEELEILTQKSPIYRVTVKVTGPKNTVSYTQSYIY
jgi:type IV pilus assembly protein PilX